MKGMMHVEGDLIGGRYEIKSYIGAGGMQEVYSAHDQCLDREVALKVPKSTSAERRFKESAALSARVNHPNTAKTLDYFTFESRQYLIEEFVRGKDLSKVRVRVPIMDPYLVAHLLHHIIKGVAASHHVDVIHRDLKPSNIIVSPGVSFAEIKITDFGIAKMAQEEMECAVEGGDESITSSQTMMGALPYLAPEMIENPKDVGKPADIWAVGAMAFEFLTGKKPFGKGLKALKNIEQAKFPEVPSNLTRNVQFAGLIGELVTIIRKCLVKDPSKRLTADKLVECCGELCYPVGERQEGFVKYNEHQFFGRILSAGGSIFFHKDSVYGDAPQDSSPVYFIKYPGRPNARAHPVVKLALVPDEAAD